jgi:hypothetical protein
MDSLINKPPRGTVRLLREDDLHQGDSFLDWKPNSQGVGKHNPRGFSEVWIVVRNGGKDLYEQPVIVENPGSIIVCQAKEKVAMLQIFRMTAERLAEVGMDYVRKLDSEKRWGDLAKTLGEWRWELPRGIAPPEDVDITEFILKTARIELREESGMSLLHARIVSRINANSNFFAHAQYVVHGFLGSTRHNNPEELEMIGETRFFSAKQIREMVNSGILNDGLTKAALADCGFHY